MSHRKNRIWVITHQARGGGPDSEFADRKPIGHASKQMAHCSHSRATATAGPQPRWAPGSKQVSEPSCRNSEEEGWAGARLSLEAFVTWR